MVLGSAFWRFWSAMALANLGDGIRMAAFPLLAATLTADPLAVAAVAAATGLPWLLAGPLAGSLADRRHARVLLAGADLGRVVVLAGLVVALLVDAVGIGLLVAAAFLLGVGEVVRDTTAQVVVPRLVPRRLIERANSRLVAGEVVSNEFVGPLVGGSLFALGAVLPFAANSAALTFAVLLTLTVPAALLTRRAPADDGPVTERGVRGGLRWLVGQPTVRVLVVVTALVAMADGAWFAVFVLYAQHRLDLGATGFGGLLAVGALGGLLGALLADRVIGERRHGPVLVGAIAVTVGTPALLLVAPELWAAVVVVLATSAGFGVFNVAVVSLRHRLVPERLLGRVGGFSRTVVLGCASLGALAGGAVGSRFGLDAPFVLGVVVGLVALGLWLTLGHWTTRGPWPDRPDDGPVVA